VRLVGFIKKKLISEVIYTDGRTDVVTSLNKSIDLVSDREL